MRAPSHSSHLPATLTVERAAEFLNISRGLAYQAIATNDLPSIRIGRRILVPTARLLELLGSDHTAAQLNPAPAEDKPIIRKRVRKAKKVSSGR